MEFVFECFVYFLDQTAHHAAYPGFETIFDCRWPISPICMLTIPYDAIWKSLYSSDRHDAIYKTVGIFVDEIERYLREEEADLGQVMRDIMGLTKINFNACIYADGRPVTLRFADRVGEILTATPLARNLPPLPFKHYI